MNFISKCVSAALLLGSFTGFAQQVPKVVVAEHFTNTWCSICASKNPPFYTNLANFPQVLHMAYHPSAPYAGCPLSMHNVVEADARTNFYGIYGGTPRVVIQGSVLMGGISFADPNIFSSVSGTTTSFAMAVALSRIGADSLQVEIRIRKTDTSSVTTAMLYAVATEDTVMLAGGNANGEPRNYDVFRKSFVGNDPISVALPAVIGDSIVISRKIAINSAWLLSRMSATAILQDAAKGAIQAARSAKIPQTSGVDLIGSNELVEVYPNPASSHLFVRQSEAVSLNYQVVNLNGHIVASGQINNGTQYLDIKGISAGIYLLVLSSGGRQYKPVTFVKE